MLKIISRVIMFAVWLLAVVTTELEVHYMGQAHGKNPHPSSYPSDVLVIGIFVFSILSCVSVRFWLARMRHPGWALIPYFLGIFFTYLTPMYGLFVLPGYFLAFRLLGVLFFWIYFPVFVRFRPAPPPPLPRISKDA
jgi:hypothetical protein